MCLTDQDGDPRGPETSISYGSGSGFGWFKYLFLQDNMGSSVAGLTQGDYRMDGKMELITCASDGEGGSDHGGI